MAAWRLLRLRSCICICSSDCLLALSLSRRQRRRIYGGIGYGRVSSLPLSSLSPSHGVSWSGPETISGSPRMVRGLVV
ncbi:hypothetical protein F4779DRAFT_584046 [Xylariaceae sp. FL0662B]|nr:hypothetical protein F4779DRAFT_584046 [Xylariaceae sp. FL0662B]